ncbi:unnamed protein product, partial [Tilletia caries]
GLERWAGGGAAANDALARGSSTGKVRTTIEWIRSVLLLHTSYLMALPHLTTRLASLHMALSSRLASHTKLLGLQGRLELVLSQIEIRAAYAAVAGRGAQGVKSRLANAGAGAPASGSKKKGAKGRGRGPADDPTRWIKPSDDADDDHMKQQTQNTEAQNTIHMNHYTMIYCSTYSSAHPSGRASEPFS